MMADRASDDGPCVRGFRCPLLLPLFARYVMNAAFDVYQVQNVLDVGCVPNNCSATQIAAMVAYRKVKGTNSRMPPPPMSPTFSFSSFSFFLAHSLSFSLSLSLSLVVFIAVFITVSIAVSIFLPVYPSVSAPPLPPSLPPSLPLPSRPASLQFMSNTRVGAGVERCWVCVQGLGVGRMRAWRAWRA